MKYFTMLLLLCFASIIAFAEKKPRPVVIKGQITHFQEDFWSFGMTTLFNNEVVNIPVSEDGHFFKTIYIRCQQDIYLYLNNDAITIFVIPGDTLSLNWDAQNFKETFNVTSKKPGRQKELNLMLKLYEKFRKPFSQLHKQIYDQSLSDSVKYKRAKKLFEQELNAVTHHPATEHTRRIICNIFYKYANLLYFAHLMRRYDLHYYLPINEAIPDSLTSYSGAVNPEILDEYNFYNSPTYRRFIYNYVGSRRPFHGFFAGEQSVVTSYLERKCYAGFASLPIRLIKDWYLTKTIIGGFSQYPFEVCKNAYQKFISLIRTPFFKDSLQHFYTAMQRLKPGAPAPQFTLKNLAGEKTSLSDFRGKVIYIDFWGVYCAPCRGDIKNYIPKLHKKYKDEDVVFLNICVDVERERWKKGVHQLHLEGVNLLAEGWETNPVCHSYNIQGIPHYVLIDKRGKMINNNASRPGRLLRVEDNEIDKLLR